MDYAAIFNKIRPEADYQDNMVNFHSLETVLKTYNGNDFPTQQECDLAWEEIETIDVPRQKTLEQIKNSDADLIRVIEDLYENIVNGTPIPQTAIDKISARKALRDKL